MLSRIHSHPPFNAFSSAFSSQTPLNVNNINPHSQYSLDFHSILDTTRHPPPLASPFSFLSPFPPFSLSPGFYFRGTISSIPLSPIPSPIPYSRPLIQQCNNPALIQLATRI